MQIILERNEYLGLRVNALEKQLIGSMRDIFREFRNNGNAELAMERIESVLKTHDKQVENSNEENQLLLW